MTKCGLDKDEEEDETDYQRRLSERDSSQRSGVGLR